LVVRTVGAMKDLQDSFRSSLNGWLVAKEELKSNQVFVRN